MHACIRRRAWIIGFIMVSGKISKKFYGHPCRGGRYGNCLLFPMLIKWFLGKNMPYSCLSSQHSNAVSCRMVCIIEEALLISWKIGKKTPASAQLKGVVESILHSSKIKILLLFIKPSGAQAILVRTYLGDCWNCHQIKESREFISLWRPLWRQLSHMCAFTMVPAMKVSNHSHFTLLLLLCGLSE